MKFSGSRRTLLAGLLATLCLLATTSAPAADDMAGKWKLVILAFGADDLAVLDVKSADGKPKAALLDWQRKMIGEIALGDFKVDGDAVSFDLKGPAIALQFSGKSDAAKSGTALGTVKIVGEVYPARLEKTRDTKVADPKKNPIIEEFLKAVREESPHAKAKAIQDLIARNAGAPSSQVLYTELLATAPAAKLPADEVDALVQKWLSEAKPYGDAWMNEARIKALRALSLSNNYGATCLRLAQEADKLTAADTPLANRAAIVGMLAKAAKNAGDAELAKDAENRLAKLEGELDAEYHEKVPPFKTPAFQGRKNAESNRTVVLELFTGAQCPPCVAADVAFDGLLKTYKPTEVIGLQYHLHIPGPDPLTNPDSLARQRYYGDEIGGTPSTFFNGRSEDAGGGPIVASEQAYDGFRGLIDGLLEKQTRAEVKVSAERKGDQIAIKADASTDDKNASKRVSLRLALTEEAIRYVGGNHLRFHHHVVRTFPNGVEGKRLTDGKGTVEIEVNIPKLRHDLEAYLSEAAKRQPFPGVLPEIALKNLSVVAFVQDDQDKSILGAVSVPVAEATP